MVELVDTRDLKSLAEQSAYGFNSRLRQKKRIVHGNDSFFRLTELLALHFFQSTLHCQNTFFVFDFQGAFKPA